MDNNVRKIKKVIDENKKIAVLCGGPSSEAEISRRSGKNVLKALHNLGYAIHKKHTERGRYSSYKIRTCPKRRRLQRKD